VAFSSLQFKRITKRRRKEFVTPIKERSDRTRRKREGAPIGKKNTRTLRLAARFVGGKTYKGATEGESPTATQKGRWLQRHVPVVSEMGTAHAGKKARTGARESCAREKINEEIEQSQPRRLHHGNTSIITVEQTPAQARESGERTGEILKQGVDQVHHRCESLKEVKWVAQKHQNFKKGSGGTATGKHWWGGGFWFSGGVKKGGWLLVWFLVWGAGGGGKATRAGAGVLLRHANHPALARRAPLS